MSVSALGIERGPRVNRQGWRWVGGALALAGLILGLLFWQEILGAYRVWLGSTTFSHCFLVLPVALYLVWERRGLVRGLAPSPDFRVLLLLPALSAAWLLAAVLGVLEAQQLVVMTMVEAILLAVLGWRIYRLLLGPFLYLYLLVPTGEFLVPSLQDLTARFVVVALGLFHVPTFSDGIIISIPEGDFIIAEACAGLRFLIASIAFGAFFAMMVYRSWWRRAAFLALAMTVPVIANGIRAWGILYIAHLTNDVVAVEADHVIYGWGFFSAIILLLIVIGTRFSDGGPVLEAEAEPAAAPAFSARRPVIAAAIAVALAALGPLYADYLESDRWRPDLSGLAAPAMGGSWHEVDASGDSWRPLVIAPDREFRDAFADGSATVERYVALYAAYGRHNNLVRSQNRVMDGDIWVRTTLGQTEAEIGGRKATIDTAQIRAGERNRLVWYFYVVDGMVTGSPTEAKLRQARDILAGRSGISAFVAIATDIPLDADAHAERVLARFAAAMQPLDPDLAAAREYGRPVSALADTAVGGKAATQR